MTLYKGLNGREATYVPGFRYRLRVWTPPVTGPLVPCRNGYHLMRAEHLSLWIARDLFVAEHDGELVDAGDKVVVRRCRIVEHLSGWNDRTARLFAADCAERVLSVYEERYPGDGRPRLAVQAARGYADGLIGEAELRAANAAAADAADADAANAAAYDAAYAAADAAYADSAAAYAAAYAAASAADAAYAYHAAYDAEREWQSARILHYARGGAA